MVRLRVRVYPQGGLTRHQRGKALVEMSVKPRAEASLSVLPTIFEWTSKKIGPCDAVVGDYLSRHNYQAFDGATEPLAIEQAMRDGQVVVTALSSLLTATQAGPEAVISVRSLYQAAGFDKRLAHFKTQYHDNARFKALVDQAVSAFLQRKLRGAQPDEDMRAHCVEYQLEELVLFELLAASGYGILVYSGPHLPVMKSLVSGGLSGVSGVLEGLTLVELRIIEPK